MPLGEICFYFSRRDLQNVFKKLNLNVDTTSLDSAINSIKAKIASLTDEQKSAIKEDKPNTKKKNSLSVHTKTA